MKHHKSRLLNTALFLILLLSPLSLAPPVAPLTALAAPPAVVTGQIYGGCAGIVRSPVAIHDIQGAAHLSPLRGECVGGVGGIVTALTGSGFYVQDPQPDADPATSEAVFVYTGATPAVGIGDAVVISGTVSEFRPGGSGGLGNLTTTELTAPVIHVTSSGNALPAATVIGAGGRVPPTANIEDDALGDVETSGAFDPAADGIDFFESLEGMRVQVNDAVAVCSSVDYGEVPVLAGGGAGLRTPRGGIVITPLTFNPARIILDDEILKLSGLAMPTVNVGDRFPGALEGVMDYSFGNYKLELTAAPAVAPGELQQEIAGDVPPYQLAIATFNVENLSPHDPPAKFATLAGQIVHNLRSPDLLAIEEIQDDNGATNDGVVDAATTWRLLIAAISAAGGPAYDFRQIDPTNDSDGGEPGGNIRQGFLFRTDRGLSFVDAPGATPVTANAVTGAGADTHLQYSPGRIAPTNPAFAGSRKPLAGEFTFKGDRVFVIANHFNSKGGDDALYGRFQPPIFASAEQRVQQATAVHDFVAEILSADPAANVVVLGDLNDFQFAQPITVLKGTILDDLVDSLDANERYTYVYDGNSEALDHILATRLTTSRPFTYDVVHTNAEFAVQASDHDPQVATLCVDATPPAVGVSVSPTRLWPPDHRYVDVTATVTVTDNADLNPSFRLVSVTSSEPDGSLNPRDRANDIVVTGDTSARLRAEQVDRHAPRVYTFTYEGLDACHNTTTVTATVTVAGRHAPWGRPVWIRDP